MEDKFAKGDKAINELERNFSAVVNSEIEFKDKIQKISEKFYEAVVPWNLKGDDRVLSGMRIAAGAAVGSLVKSELKRIKESNEKSNLKEKKLSELKSEIENIQWLADGFKSSIKVDIAFLISDIRLNINSNNY